LCRVEAKPAAGCGGAAVIEADGSLDDVAHAVAEFEIRVGSILAEQSCGIHCGERNETAHKALRQSRA
jgi:hypothetical protein